MEEAKRSTRALVDLLCGAGIGCAFIIPGFSGGSVAAILGVYERIVGAVADFFKHPLRSAAVLLPFLIGGILGAAALVVPIRAALGAYPVPTLSLFVGLSLGGLPAIKREIPGKPSAKNLLAFFLPFLLSLGLVFLPEGVREEGFLYRLDALGYLLLFLVGAAAACALAIPGVSGSMILLILGYYAPLVDLIVNLFARGTMPARSLSVIAVAVLGMAAGFVGVSFLMRFLLKKYRTGTYYAVLGLIAGSIAAVYVPLAGMRMSALLWILSLFLLAAGAGLSLALFRFAARKGEPVAKQKSSAGQAEPN